MRNFMPIVDLWGRVARGAESWRDPKTQVRGPTGRTCKQIYQLRDAAVRSAPLLPCIIQIQVES